VFYDKDADVSNIRGKKVAVTGCGSQAVPTTGTPALRQMKATYNREGLRAYRARTGHGVRCVW